MQFLSSAEEFSGRIFSKNGQLLESCSRTMFCLILSSKKCAVCHLVNTWYSQVIPQLRELMHDAIMAAAEKTCL